MVRRICPRWEGLGSYVVEKIWWIVCPPGDRGEVEAESFVAKSRRACPPGVRSWVETENLVATPRGEAVAG